MRNIIKNTVVIAVLISSLALITTAKDIALVVKQDGTKVFLDTSEFKTPASVGDRFRVATTGEEIINPKTGKSLGREITDQVDGHITQVEAMYSIGRLDKNINVVGKEAEVEVKKQLVTSDVSMFEPKTQDSFNEARLMPVWRSNLVEGKASAAASADITGDAKNDLILAFANDNVIKVFSLADNTLKEEHSIKINPLRKIISLDAADVKNTGKAQIFATILDTSSQKFSTFVIELKDGELKQTDTIRGLVKGIAPNNGKRVLYTQNIANASNNMTQPALLVYKNGKFDSGEKLTAGRFNSVYGFSTSDFRHNGKEYVVYTTPNSKLRVQFDKKNSYIESPSDIDFNTTPVRVKYNNSLERLWISVAVFKNSEGATFIAGIENNAKLGILSDTFGSYNSAKLHILKWTGNSLVQESSAELGGVVYDIVQGSLGNFENVIIVPYASTSGDTTVELFRAH